MSDKKRLYITPELHDRLLAVSERYGVPMQTLTAMALGEWLGRVEDEGLWGRNDG